MSCCLHLQEVPLRLRYPGVDLRPIVHGEGPGQEPDQAEAPEHVEDDLPARVLAQVARHRHADHRAERAAWRAVGHEPGHKQDDIWYKRQTVPIHISS